VAEMKGRFHFPKNSDKMGLAKKFAKSIKNILYVDTHEHIGTVHEYTTENGERIRIWEGIVSLENVSHLSFEEKVTFE
jgi:hypothetical protein